MRRNASILTWGCLWASSLASAAAQQPAVNDNSRPAAGSEARPLVRIVEGERSTWARIRRVPTAAAQRPLAAPPLPQPLAAGPGGAPREITPAAEARRLAPRLSDMPPPDFDALKEAGEDPRAAAIPEAVAAAESLLPEPAGWSEPHRQPPTLGNRPWLPDRVDPAAAAGSDAAPLDRPRRPLADRAPDDASLNSLNDSSSEPELNVMEVSGALQASAGDAIVLQTEVRIERAEVVDEQICQLKCYTDRELALVGRRGGRTYLLVWFAGHSQALCYRVEVEDQLQGLPAAERGLERGKGTDPPPAPLTDSPTLDPKLALPEATDQASSAKAVGDELRPTSLRAAYRAGVLGTDGGGQLSQFIGPLDGSAGARPRVQAASAHLGTGRLGRQRGPGVRLGN